MTATTHGGQARGEEGSAGPAPRVDLGLVREAGGAIASQVVRTPVARAEVLSAATGAEVWVKFENLQFTASYKERGALFRLLSLPEDVARRGLVTSSAGNFAQAVAHHATRLGLPVTIVMPLDTPRTKVARTEVLGGTVVHAGRSYDEARAVAEAMAAERNWTYLSPFDDPYVIAGQGTVALEYLEDAPDLDVLVVPVGGGGLVAGMAVAAKALRPGIEVIGVQSARYAGMRAALGAGPPALGGPTIAEGIAVAEPGLLTREIVARLVDHLVVVEEAAIEEAMCLLLEYEKTVVEGAGAAGLAALLAEPARFAGRRVGLVLTGGNVDLLLLASVVTRGMLRSGRLARLSLELPDSPGSIGLATATIGTAGGNILEIRHERSLLDLPSRVVEVAILVETNGADHAHQIEEALRGVGVVVRARVTPG